MRKDVARYILNHVLVLADADHAMIKRHRLSQNVAVKEIGHTPGGCCRDGFGKRGGVRVLDTMPHDAQPGEQPVILADMRRELARKAFQ